MLYGKILRPPAYGAKLKSIDLSAAKAMQGVVVVQEGDFVGFAAPTRFEAEQALAAAAKTSQWEGGGGSTNNDELYDYLPKHARGGVSANPFGEQMSNAAKALKQQYHVAYIQHAPMEPRAAVAEWDGNKVTVWCGTQNPFGVKGEVARALKRDPAEVRVIVPDVGGAFGGKHFDTGALEAARLAKAAGKPVSYRWTRQEEFTWAYFRPAGVIFAEASLDASNKLTSWHFINVNSGPSAVESPYTSGKSNCKFIPSDGPLRPGSYRGLASTANTFAREVFIDELATLAGQDPLEFRRNHLAGQGDRLRAVLDLAAEKFAWPDRRKDKRPNNVGIGLACGTEKRAYTAACAEVEFDPAKKSVRVHRVVQAFECGAIVNPSGLTMQIQGAIVQGLGAILREEIRFADGKVNSDSFSEYKVPRFADLPAVEVHLLDRKDLPSSGAGETPIIAVAPAVANAVFDAIGHRVRSMPMRLEKA
jgi:isoquinoline 1-oxidoreductase